MPTKSTKYISHLKLFMLSSSQHAHKYITLKVAQSVNKTDLVNPALGYVNLAAKAMNCQEPVHLNKEVFLLGTGLIWLHGVSQASKNI